MAGAVRGHACLLLRAGVHLLAAHSLCHFLQRRRRQVEDEDAMGRIAQRTTTATPPVLRLTMNNQYEKFLAHVACFGTPKGDRTGTGTRSVFGYQMRFDLADGFPLVTTKFVPLRLVVLELLWFLSGNTNVRWLQERNCHIWDEWANANGELGPVYGKQWRAWEDVHCIRGEDVDRVDQITWLVDRIKSNPDCRRLIVSAWNVAELPLMALAPCHCLFQFYVANGRLSCQLYQRSADIFLGVPFNIASYALLTHMVAQQCGLEVGDLVWTGGDCHIYDNHTEQVTTQLAREPYSYPMLVLARKPASIFDYQPEDFILDSYVHHPAIKAPVAV